MGIPAVNPSTIYLPDALRQLNIQTGTATLVSGTVTVTGVTINTSNSIILFSMRDPGAGALTTMIELDCPVGTRTATQFVVNAIDTAKATLATAACTFDWMIISI
jgi:hypothetical protein